MNSNFTLIFYAALCLAVVTHASARTWTDAATGRTLEGDFLTSDATHVVVKTGGKPVKIAIARLSEADKAFIREKAGPPAPAGGLESQIVGYWAPDANKTAEAADDELDPLEVAFLGKTIFEIQKDTMVTHFSRKKKTTENYTVKDEDKAKNTLTLEFTNRESTLTLQGAQLTIVNGPFTIVCNRISKEQFGKRYSESPADTKPESSDAGAEDADEISAILNQALEEQQDKATREKVAAFFKSLLPTKGADGEEIEWDVDFLRSGNTFPLRTALISAKMYPKGDRGTKLMWSHIIYNREKSNFNSSEKFEGYGINRSKNSNAFLTVNKVSFRLIVSDESYKDDKKIDAILKATDLGTMEKL